MLTAADVVNAAADTIDGITSGTLRASEVQARAVAAMRETFGRVGSGPSDALYALHVDVIRQGLRRHP